MSKTNQNNSTYANGQPPYKRRPLDPHLFANEQAGIDEVLVQSGYPIWTLIAQWINSKYNDEEILAAYSDMPRDEWEAAKRYYLDHKVIFDARIIRNTQPYADEDTPPLRTLEEYFTWYAQLNREPADPADTQNTANGSEAHG
jgi:uncharacterized protein (DUF433 family)